ncbi:MAG: nuclear transport factor 2 family protein [Arenicella sp.]|nr:nuclear transport factor 2 family protein [Arenicella sp.]
MKRRHFLHIATSSLLASSHNVMSIENTAPKSSTRKTASKQMDDYPYAKPVDEYPQPEFINDSLRLHFGSALLDRRNLFHGFDENLIAYGMAPDPIGREELIDFYSAVFDSFPDFRLVDDSLLIAGDMGAHRYHALGTLGGVGGADARQIMFRGQTIYRINKYGRVIWRISNHDHDFRESQIAYATNNRLEQGYRSWAPSVFTDQRRALEPLRERFQSFQCDISCRNC